MTTCKILQREEVGGGNTDLPEKEEPSALARSDQEHCADLLPLKRQFTDLPVIKLSVFHPLLNRFANLDSNVLIFPELHTEL